MTCRWISGLVLAALLLLPISTNPAPADPLLEDAPTLIVHDSARSSPDLLSELELGSPSPSFMRLLTGQDKKDGKNADGTVTIEVKLTKLPTGSPFNAADFVPKQPLKLTGNPTSPASLRSALWTGIDFLVRLQGKDGSWSYDPKQVRKYDVSGREIKTSGFMVTAEDSLLHPTNDFRSTVLTALCCMGLRRHTDIEPKRIGPAVEKGLRFVLDRAPKHDKQNYGPWTWSFTLLFLCEEFQHTQDSSLQAQIKEAAKGIVARLAGAQHGAPPSPLQHPGNLKPSQQELDEIAKNKDKPEPKREINGGYLGTFYSEEAEAEELDGILIVKVDPKGPAAQAGIKPGDRIVAIEQYGKKYELEDVDDLISLIESFKPDSRIKIKLLRGGKGAMAPSSGPRPAFYQQRRKPAAAAPAVPRDGGWSYYAMGSVSFTTASCVISLMKAKEIGVDVPDEMISRAVNLVEAMQMRREGTDEIAFRYHTGLRGTKGRAADIRGSVGRLGVCGLTLFKAGQWSAEDLGKTLENFVKHRGELDKVKGYPGNHFMRSWLNAAYYFLFGHFYTAMAVNSLPDAAQRKKIGGYLQEAILHHQTKNPDGTWTDHEMWGKVTGTAMALMVLGELKELAPTLYKSAQPAAPTAPPKDGPATQDGKKK